jgi:hypothetical protein
MVTKKDPHGSGDPHRRLRLKRMLTPELADAVYNEIVQGATYPVACAMHGVQRRLGDMWREQGEKDFDAEVESVDAYWFEVMTQGRAHAVGQAEKYVYAGRDGWQASARWLEAISPDNWVRRQEMTGREGGPILIKEVRIHAPEGP